MPLLLISAFEILPNIMSLIRLLLLNCLVLVTCTALAQEKPINFGFRAGAGIATLSRGVAQDIGIAKKDKPVAGFLAGAYASVTLGDFSLQPAIYYIAKGAQTTEDVYSGDIGYRAYGKLHLSYLQVPLNFIYNIKINNGTYFIGGGPYVSTGLKASFKPSSIDGLDKIDNWPDTQYTFGNTDTDGFKRFEYGINMLAGYRFYNGLFFNGGFDLGLTNIRSQSYLYKSSKTRLAVISLGYQLP